MLIETERVTLSTRGDCHILDVTGNVQEVVDRHGLQEGHVLVFCQGSTGALSTVEFEPGLLVDLPELFERLAPRDIPYRHDETWHDGNGHSHVRATLVGPSLTIPVEKGKLQLGTWQQVIFMDFDNRPRDRNLVVQVLGLGR